MLTLKYILIGIIQGIFEWLPISSEGIVALVSQVLIKNFHPLEIALFAHLGTFFAVMIYFRKDWFKVLIFKDKDMFKFLFISTAISGALGFLLYEAVKGVAIGNSLLIVTGVGLLFTAYFHKSKKIIKLSKNKLAVFAGILQGFAVIPGLSRSGATIFALSFSDFSSEKILKTSYMMSGPVVLGMTGYLFLKNPVLLFEGWPVLLFSFLTGFLTLKLLLKVARQVDFTKFAISFAVLCFIGAFISFIF